MIRFLEGRKSFHQEINGFRQNRSSIFNITALVSSIEESLNSGCTPTAIFLDVKAAFDAVLHAAILEGLHVLGGRIYVWIADYLDGRQHFMSIQTAPLLTALYKRVYHKGLN